MIFLYVTKNSRKRIGVGELFEMQDLIGSDVCEQLFRRYITRFDFKDGYIWRIK